VNNERADRELIDDPLAREIEEAFDVEPSPTFVTRVLANRPARRAWTFPWTFTIPVASAAAGVVAIFFVIPDRGARTPAPIATTANVAPPIGQLSAVTTPASEAEPAAAPATPAPHGETRIASTRAAAVISPAAEPEVLFAKDETAALQRLTRGLSRGAVDPETVGTPVVTGIVAIQAGPIVLPPLLDMSPVTLEPLGALAEGVRQ
jgi:hypothetical protein